MKRELGFLATDLSNYRTMGPVAAVEDIGVPPLLLQWRGGRQATDQSLQPVGREARSTGQPE
ncbi:MAG: hypothetical protein ABEH65_11850 [Halobacteriales archaeon]